MPQMTQRRKRIDLILLPSVPELRQAPVLAPEGLAAVVTFIATASGPSGTESSSSCFRSVVDLFPIT